ncbi:hypothetical protein C2S51_018530 [Perilla frutescens var. frutescens]|nr:hypothetical protein C2S51_018530 [Perilla frutescens var. frutescens]
MAATAYAAAVSLLNTMDQIKIHPFLSTYFNKYSIELLREKVDFFVDFVEKYSDAESEEAEDLVRRIGDVAHETEEMINVEAAHRIRISSTRKNLIVTGKLKKITQEMDCIKEKAISFMNPYSSSSAPPPTAGDLVRQMAVVALKAEDIYEFKAADQNRSGSTEKSPTKSRTLDEYLNSTHLDSFALNFECFCPMFKSLCCTRLEELKKTKGRTQTRSRGATLGRIAENQTEREKPSARARPPGATQPEPRPRRLRARSSGAIAGQTAPRSLCNAGSGRGLFSPYLGTSESYFHVFEARPPCATQTRKCMHTRSQGEPPIDLDPEIEATVRHNNARRRRRMVDLPPHVQDPMIAQMQRQLEVMQEQLRAQEEARNRNVEAPIRNLFQPVVDQGCPGHGFGTDHQVCIFYGGSKDEVRTFMDAAAGGSLLARGPEEALRIIKEMASNSFQWPATREGVQILKKVASASSSDALGLVAAQMATLNSKMEAFTNPKAETSQSQFEDVNYVNQQGGFSNQPRQFNQGYKPQYGGQYGGNSGYQNKAQHPNFSYGNPNNAIQPPPGFSVTNGVIDEEKKPKMDELLMAFMGKTESYMKDSQARIGKLENTVGAIGNQVNILEKQMGQFATILGSQHQQGKFPSNTTVNPKDQCKAITLRSGTTYDGPEMPDDEESREKVDEQPSEKKKEEGPS